MTVPSQRPIDYAHYLPWTRLFRSLRIATDPRKLLLAAIGLLVFWCGDAALSRLPFAPPTDAPPAPPWNAAAPALLLGRDDGLPSQFQVVSHLRSLSQRVVEPVRPLLAMGGMLVGGEKSWSEVAYLWTRLFWTLAVWSIFGGAIARLAALEFARDERGGLVAAVTFSLRRFLSLFSAPLLPIAGILILSACCAAGGLIGQIIYIGPWIVAAAWGLFAVAALLVVLSGIALAVGWPLMVAAVATEDSDAFDGFSRAFSYLYSRPWLAVWCGLVAITLGMLLVAAVDTLAVTVQAIASRMVATGMGDAAVDRLHARPPRYFAPVHAGDATGAITVPARIVSVWLALLATIAVGFAVSYFWSAATVIYFLLRRADDGTDFDDVWLGEVEDDDLLPLAGIAAGDQPVVERSHLPTVPPPANV